MVLSASFLVTLDFFVVNVAIPSIRAGLDASFADLQLVIASYGLTYSVLLITGGRLGISTAASACSFAESSGLPRLRFCAGWRPVRVSSIASRAIQGSMAAMLMPQVLSVIQVTFPVHERANAFGFFGMVVGTASFSGNVLGGLLVSANVFGLRWRPIFLINLPIGAMAILAARRTVRESRSPKARRLDLGGVALMTASLSMLLYPLVKGREAGWPAWTYACAAASALLLALFVRYEQGVTARGGSPLVELSLFHDRAFVIGLSSAVCFFSTTASFFLISTIFLQNGLGYSARDAGLTFGSFAIAFLCSSLASVRVQPKLGSRIINTGAAFMMCGLAVLLWMARSRGAALTGLELAPALMIYGTGQGFVMPTLISTILINIKGHDAGSASGVLTTVQQCSFAMGVAAIGTVFFSALGGRTGADVFVHALSRAFSVNICLLGATFLLILQIPRNPVKDARP